MDRASSRSTGNISERGVVSHYWHLGTAHLSGPAHSTSKWSSTLTRAGTSKAYILIQRVSNLDPLAPGFVSSGCEGFSNGSWRSLLEWKSTQTQPSSLLPTTWDILPVGWCWSVSKRRSHSSHLDLALTPPPPAHLLPGDSGQHTVGRCDF